MDQRLVRRRGRLCPHGAADYAAFLYTIPGQISFGESCTAGGNLGADAEPHPHLGARFALGAEYFIKIGYAWLIQKALDASSDDGARDILFCRTLPPATLAKERASNRSVR